jgi:hypothetical protein
MEKYFNKAGVEITETECNTMKASGVMFSNKDGDRHEFSDAKRIKREADVAADQAREPTQNWEAAMKKSDLKMIPRHMEDLITNNATLVIPTEMKTRYDEKVVLRATKP